MMAKTITVSYREAGLVAAILRHEADILRRRHPSDGIFQDAYTPDQCAEFKRESDLLNDLAERLE